MHLAIRGLSRVESLGSVCTGTLFSKTTHIAVDEA